MLKRFSMAVARGRRSKLPRLWLMTDSERLKNPGAAVASLPPGCGVVLRHRDQAARARLGQILQPLCRRQRLVLVVAGDWRLAAALRCDGVHLPEQSMVRGAAPGLRLWRRNRRGLLTAAAHSQRAVRRAANLGADAVFLAPVLATPSRPQDVVLGRVKTAAIVGRSAVPIIALGGLGPQRLRQLNGVGNFGVAGVSFAAPKN